MLSYVRQNFPHGHNARAALQWVILLVSLLICVTKGIDLLVPSTNINPIKLASQTSITEPPSAPLQSANLQAMSIAKNKEIQTNTLDSSFGMSDLPTLIGIVKSNRKSAYAVIKIGTAQGVYSVGESILLEKQHNNARYRVIIDSIGMEHIVVSRDGLKYQLPLASDKAEHKLARKIAQLNAPAISQSQARANRRPVPPPAKANVPQLRALLLNAPTSLSRYIRISEQHDNGSLASYRLQPGIERSLFDSAGLLPNDEISHIENLAVNKFKLQKLPALLARGQLSVTLLRDNKPYNVHFTF